MLDFIGEILIRTFIYAIEIPLIWLGEIVLWILTLGRRQPQWDCHAGEGGGAFVLLSTISLWVGLATAIAIVLTVQLLFF